MAPNGSHRLPFDSHTDAEVISVMLDELASCQLAPSGRLAGRSALLLTSHRGATIHVLMRLDLVRDLVGAVEWGKNARWR